MKAIINNHTTQINEDQTKIMWQGRWREITEDQEGEHYFICDSEAIYFEVIE